MSVCVDYRDINRACPKDNYMTPFKDQIVKECAESEIFSFMDNFYRYNQINILPVDQHKMNLICPWGTFAYKKIPFVLKMLVIPSNEQCIMLFVILSISLNLISMTDKHILLNVMTILITFKRYFFVANTTIFI